MTCKGWCDRYRANKPGEGSRYANGQKRCQICEIFIWFNGLFCPCCNYRLRGKPRNIVCKARYEAIKAVEDEKSYGIDMGNKPKLSPQLQKRKEKKLEKMPNE